MYDLWPQINPDQFVTMCPGDVGSDGLTLMHGDIRMILSPHHGRHAVYFMEREDWVCFESRAGQKEVHVGAGDFYYWHVFTVLNTPFVPMRCRSCCFGLAPREAACLVERYTGQELVASKYGLKDTSTQSMPLVRYLEPSFSGHCGPSYYERRIQDWLSQETYDLELLAIRRYCNGQRDAWLRADIQRLESELKEITQSRDKLKEDLVCAKKEAKQEEDRLRGEMARVRSRAKTEAIKLRQSVCNFSAVKDIVAFRGVACGDEESLQYPDVPGPMCPCSEAATKAPPCSGIYFLWWDGVVSYVGQSISVRSRLSNHEKLPHADYVSWVEIDLSQLDFAECWYIGLLKPPLNFGRKAKWRQHKRGAVQEQGA